MTVIASPGLERRLKAQGVGEILFDAFSRGRYATDASSYQMMPLGVVVPRSVAEAERAIAVARSEGVSVLARGGGSSQCGQTVNHSLVTIAGMTGNNSCGTRSLRCGTTRDNV